jgi:hypothetical protein
MESKVRRMSVADITMVLIIAGTFQKEGSNQDLPLVKMTVNKRVIKIVPTTTSNHPTFIIPPPFLVFSLFIEGRLSHKIPLVERFSSSTLPHQGELIISSLCPSRQKSLQNFYI